jgi:hypothetical protein
LLVGADQEVLLAVLVQQVLGVLAVEVRVVIDLLDKVE